MNTPPPPLNISRAGISNFPEVHKWAVENSSDWLLVERWRKTYGWTDEEYLEVLAVQLLHSLQKAEAILIADGRMVAPPLPPDPVVPPLFQEEEPDKRSGAMLLIALGFVLLIVACIVQSKGHSMPAIGTLGLGCGAFAVALTRKV